jgi:hypothetical protein
MGPDSKPRVVLSICSGIDKMYRIVPALGQSFICNEPHVLTMKGIVPYLVFDERQKMPHIVKWNPNAIPTSRAFATIEDAQEFIDKLPENIFDMPLNEYLKLPDAYKEDCHVLHVGVTFPKKAVPIDPYIIGYWLRRNSDSKPPILTITEAEILAYFTKNITKYNLKLIHDNNNSDSNHFLTVLNDLKLSDDKHIPDIFKINSRKIRLRLLAGIIECSGYVAETGAYIEICENHKKLSEDIEYLCFSLGFMVTKTERDCQNILTIYGDCLKDIPTVLSQHKYSPCSNKRSTCLQFDVEPVGEGRYYGFTLDGDGRFLLNDFLVTHNTTIINEVVHNLELKGVSYIVTSFTGKAVARVREVTGKKSPATIHRLIMNTKKSKLDKKSNQFDLDIPLSEYEHVIIDEASMVTTELFHDLLQAYPNVKKWTFFGDCNQLLPIGWGSLFSEMIKSETIPVYKLTKNFRVFTKDGSRDGIILNASAILTHENPYPFEFVEMDNFKIYEGGIESVYDIIKGCYSSGLPIEEVMVLSPYNKDIYELNKNIQAIYNGKSRGIKDSRGMSWHLNDKVMLIENDASIGVFNGETGFISAITDKSIIVDFGSSGCHEFLLEPSQPRTTKNNTIKSFMYRDALADEVFDDAEEDYSDERTVIKLVLAYAISIDKAQGSESSIVILYFSEFNVGNFLNKNRIYTAISRSRNVCYIVTSDIGQLHHAATKNPPYRCENLSRRLQLQLPNMKPFKLESHVLQNNEDLPLMPPQDIPPDYGDMGYDEDDF